MIITEGKSTTIDPTDQPIVWFGWSVDQDTRRQTHKKDRQKEIETGASAWTAAAIAPARCVFHNKFCHLTAQEKNRYSYAFVVHISRLCAADCWLLVM